MAGWEGARPSGGGSLGRGPWWEDAPSPLQDGAQGHILDLCSHPGTWAPRGPRMGPPGLCYQRRSQVCGGPWGAGARAGLGRGGAGPDAEPWDRGRGGRPGQWEALRAEGSLSLRVGDGRLGLQLGPGGGVCRCRALGAREASAAAVGPRRPGLQRRLSHGPAPAQGRESPGRGGRLGGGRDHPLGLIADTRGWSRWLSLELRGGPALPWASWHWVGGGGGPLTQVVPQDDGVAPGPGWPGP